MTGDLCSCSCEFDGPAAELWTDVTRTARKEHQCIECRGPIKPGTKYIYTKALQDGTFWDAKTCLACQAVCDDLMCGCRAFGMMWEDISQGLDFGDDGDWLK